MTEDLTPKQKSFLENYLDIKSETFGNALRSALKAGYTEEYAESITSKDLKWLADNVGDVKMLVIAERNLNKFHDLD